MKVSTPNTWNINIDGNTHEVVYISNITRKRIVLTVDDERIPIDKKSMNVFLGMEQPFYIDGIECLLVSYNGKIDLVVDGISQKTGQPYITNKKLPWWFWVFFALVEIPLLVGGAILPFLLVVGVSMLCAIIVRKPDFSTGIKVLLCFLTSGVAWGLFVLICYLAERAY